jgi:RNA polymerase sigma-70 factor (ECF subfamily)
MFAGDERAASELVSRYQGPLFGLLYRLTGNAADAEELFQETFVRVLRASARFDPSRRFRPWLYAIAVNLARDRTQRQAHRATPELRPNDELPEAGGDGGEANHLLRLDLARALATLSEAHREAIVLKYFEGLEEREIAEAAGVPAGTIKSRLHHAIENLRAALDSGRRRGEGR